MPITCGYAFRGSISGRRRPLCVRALGAGDEVTHGRARTAASTIPETFNSLMTGLEEHVFGRLTDATWIYPGHGNDSTLGAERPHLEEWRARCR